MQQDGKSLKQAADELGVNYSTAKTIVQTFRKEKRITKKPKRMIETKKAIKRERYLSKLLSESKVAKLLSQVLSSELLILQKAKALEEPAPLTPPVGLSEASTFMATVQPSDVASPAPKGLPRVVSAGQMVLFPLEEDGPKPGQVSRAVSACMDAGVSGLPKKDIFYVYCEDNPEEEYKGKIDYDNPVLLRAKLEEKPTEILAKLPMIPAATTCSAFIPVTKRLRDNLRVESEPKPVFKFEDYTIPIIYNFLNEYETFLC